ncbi:energy transducer TonB [Confluentibacter sediminis]|uniref:energy transducer TonB n=1 Tax=Confluentibacter sediminis TaxID=2219045 RepID=UPI000DAE726F|nr:energy transducer TonB [Confluentibacter sediminis]
MRTPKKTPDLIRQNEQVVKKSQKHDTNLQKNSVLYFQVGLIVCLLTAYGLFEMKFEYEMPRVVDVLPPDDPNDFVIDFPFIPETPKKSDPIIKEKLASKSLEPEIVPNDTALTPFDNVDEPVTKHPQLNPSSVKVVDIPEEIPVPIALIEQVPIYPGCEKEKSNDARRKCMSEKISKLVKKQFDANLAGELGLSGKQVIQTQFKIDKTGHVSDVKVRASHPKLKGEAERVINKIPEMTPGKQQDKNVGVIYNLPIVFIVQN